MSIFQSLDKLDLEEIEIPTLSGSLNTSFSTIEYGYKTFLDKIIDGSLSDIQIDMDILINYYQYCDSDNFENADTQFVFRSLWTNQRYLESFLRVLPNLKLSLFEKSTIAKIAYDYYSSIPVAERLNSSNIVKMLLLEISKQVFSEKIIPLTTMMKEESALFIVLSRYSSFNIQKCVDRVNNMIIKLGYDFSVKQIIYIYSKLFIDCFSKLFIYTMVYIVDESTLTPIQIDLNNRISIAILVILNSMPTIEMNKVLNEYSSYCGLYAKPVRFSLKTIDGDYDRLKPLLDATTLDLP